jgi:hypothetical protein
MYIQLPGQSASVDEVLMVGFGNLLVRMQRVPMAAHGSDYHVSV